MQVKKRYLKKITVSKSKHIFKSKNYNILLYFGRKTKCGKKIRKSHDSANIVDLLLRHGNIPEIIRKSWNPSNVLKIPSLISKQDQILMKEASF